MEKIRKLSQEELERINMKVYDVLIGSSDAGRIHMRLSQPEYECANLSFFIELGYIVTVQKNIDDVQDIK